MNPTRGRPRSFDKDTALDLALQIFWLKGYQATSMSELTEATGLNKPSLYAAFGDKEALYLQALQRYVQTQLPPRAAVLDSEADGRKAVERFLRALAAMYCDPQLPGGCLVLTGASECGSPSTPAPIDAALRETVAFTETMLLQRLQRAQREGHLPRGARTQELAVFFSAVLAGLGVMAKAGAKRAKLDGAISAAMRAWPSS
jgi:AcrR family transcriptional regulator